MINNGNRTNRSAINDSNNHSHDLGLIARLDSFYYLLLINYISSVINLVRKKI